MTSSDDALSGAENRMNKTTTQNEPARQALRKTFSVSEFMAFGERYGIDYRFPQLLQSRSLRTPARCCGEKWKR